MKLVMPGILTFQSTRPIRGATHKVTEAPAQKHISIHAPHTGRDLYSIFSLHYCIHFNPRAPYGARQTRKHKDFTHGTISIHAPHTGRDVTEFFVNIKSLRISIHAPHTGRDRKGYGNSRKGQKFQSTRPIRGATPRQQEKYQGQGDFNPRAPYGARQQKCIIYVLHFCNNRQSKHKNQQETSSVRTFF